MYMALLNIGKQSIQCNFCSNSDLVMKTIFLIEETFQTRIKIILGVFFALGCLSAWHSSLISHNETSIETHINKAETTRMKELGKVYVNPYDLGPRKNWRLFLNFNEMR